MTLVVELEASKWMRLLAWLAAAEDEAREFGAEDEALEIRNVRLNIKAQLGE